MKLTTFVLLLVSRAGTGDPRVVCFVELRTSKLAGALLERGGKKKKVAPSATAALSEWKEMCFSRFLPFLKRKKKVCCFILSSLLSGTCGERYGCNLAVVSSRSDRLAADIL